MKTVIVVCSLATVFNMIIAWAMLYHAYGQS